MKRILVTAGTVYGRLDDNKLVGNRVRGVWATKFASYMQRCGYDVTLLVSDIQEKEIGARIQEEWVGDIAKLKNLLILTHTGFWSYRDACLQLAKENDAAIMAAAVVNWIPETPFKGKMPTVGVGERMMLPFILAPRVIDSMKHVNPKLTLIACKLTVGETYEHLIEAGYKTLLSSRANAVVANEMKYLQKKYIIHQDRVVHPISVDAPEFFPYLQTLIEDEHYTTEFAPFLPNERRCPPEVYSAFDSIVDKYRNRFIKRVDGSDFVFGSLALPYPDGTSNGWSALLSPREKGQMFTSKDAAHVRTAQVGASGIGFDHKVIVTGIFKASLNAPLLLRHLERYSREDGSGIRGVIHLHEQLPDVPTVPYAPPGTLRDNHREIPAVAYNIEGHGCIAGLDSNGDIVK